MLLVKSSSRLAILKVITPGKLILKSLSSLYYQDATDGKEIGRGSGLPMSMLTSVEAGSVVSFSGKDIEVMEEITEERFNQTITSAKASEQSKGTNLAKV